MERPLERTWLAGIVATALAFSLPARGAEDEAEPGDPVVEQTRDATPKEAEGRQARVAIQRPKFQMAHEFALAVGMLPLDAFQKGFTASLSYTVHFEDYLAWELVRATGAMLTSTHLRDELIDVFAIPPEDFSAPRFMLTTGIELSPIYGKQVFLNDVVVHQAVFVGLHGGVILGDRATVGDLLDTGNFRPAAGIGLGYRMFLTKTLSLRFDARDFLSLRSAVRQNERFDIENVLSLTAGISMNVWRDDA